MLSTLLALGLACTHQADLTPAAAPTFAADEAVPFDPDVTHGQLDNGFRYFIERSARPPGRAELRLVVRAGSVQEDDDQLGIAHFVEHMAFNGTEHFPGTSLVQTLQSFGLGFGAHLNASTHYEHTLYQITVPTDDPATMDTALTVVGDWAQGVLFDPVEVEKERGVVIEEWRRSRGAMQRWRDRWNERLLEGSRYADRDPIGTEASLQTLTPELVRRFYDDWYRPDLMSLVVVGDVDAEALEDDVRARFADLRLPASPRPWSLPELPAISGPRFVVQVDPELSGANFVVSSVTPHTEPTTWGAYREMVLDNMALGVVNLRLMARSQEADAPFLGAGLMAERIFPTTKNHILSGGAPADRLLEGLEAALVEVERAKRHGATPAELDRARRLVGADYADYRAMAANEDAQQATAELVRHVTDDEPVPGTEAEVAYVQRILPEITLDDLNRALARLQPTRSQLVGIALPALEGVTPPTEEAIAQVLSRVAAMDIPPPAAVERSAPLVAGQPPPGRVVAERTWADTGVLEWTLSNGATVLVKASSSEPDTIYYRARSWGGSSLYEAGDHVPAATAADLAVSSGLADHDINALIDILAGRRASVTPFVSLYEEGFNGQASAADIETLCQLVWLRALQPRFDPVTFQREKAAGVEALKNRDALPHARFEREWNRVVWHDDPRVPSWDVARLDEMDLDRSQAIYRERFGTFGDAVHIFVGDVDPGRLRSLVETWLATIPGPAEPESWRDVGLRPATEAQRFEVRAGSDPKAIVQMRYGGDFTSTPDDRHALRSMTDVLEMLLSEDLREELGGTYSVNVVTSTEEQPAPAYAITISFQCDPGRVDELTAATDAVIDRLVREPAPPGAVQAVAEQQRRSWEVNHDSNLWWATALLANRQRGEDPRELLRYNTLWQNLSPESVQATAARYLDPAHRITGVLLPENIIE